MVLRSCGFVGLLLIGQLGAACGDSGETGRLVGMTAAHNEVRASASTPTPDPSLPPLTWSDELADTAQDYADELADSMEGNRCPLVHSGAEGLGENLFASYGGVSTAENAVELWASEVDCYEFGAFKQGDSCSSACDDYGGCGHYTQLVWRGTTEVGCGVADCGGGQVWVCNYTPQGNIITRLPY